VPPKDTPRRRAEEGGTRISRDTYAESSRNTYPESGISGRASPLDDAPSPSHLVIFSSYLLLASLELSDTKVYEP